MNENTIHDINGNLLERTTEEVVNGLIVFKKYNGQGNLLEEWTKKYIPPEPTQDDYLLDLDFRLSMIELGL